RFNLSHTQGLIACAIVLRQDIGIDIENVNRNSANRDIAKRFFSAQEVVDLSSKPTHSFFDYWTLKESYIKACGMGLSLPLHKFTFHLDDCIKISFNSDWHDDPKQWQFWLLEPTPSYRMAIAIHGTENYRLKMKVTIPLISEQEFDCKVLNH
ncbi:4'-phosphopantetheinyl transferase superfamily protein, partial [Thiotrichales bacterium HSG1]|nr:4'-phosphopantetheinyl transferase superfamily protein [Thiotrichales bacterium HSG1]